MKTAGNTVNEIVPAGLTDIEISTMALHQRGDAGLDCGARRSSPQYKSRGCGWPRPAAVTLSYSPEAWAHQGP